MRDREADKAPAERESAAKVGHMPRHTWKFVKDYVEEKIVTGEYSQGSWLPSVRYLAGQLGVNRNAIYKAYRSLVAGRAVDAAPGKGLRVISARGDGGDGGQRAVLSPALLVQRAAIEGASAGLSEHAFLELARTTAYSVYRAKSPAVVFIECTEQSAIEMSNDLSMHIGHRVAPAILDAFLADPERYLDESVLLATTTLHASMIREVLGDCQRIVQLDRMVSTESLLELARVVPERRVAVIAGNASAVRPLVQAVEQSRGRTVMATAMTRTLRMDDTREPEVMVDTLLSHALVARMKPDLPTVTVRFHIERRSVDALRSTIDRACSRYS